MLALTLVADRKLELIDVPAPPPPQADEVQIRGQSTYPVSGYPDQTIRLNFGIERYYVPEGQGRDIEIGQRESRISVVVAVDDSGTAVIKALRDEGRQLYEEPLY